MIPYLSWCAVLATVTVASVAAMDVLARGRSASLRHGLWMAGLLPLLVGPLLLALVSWAPQGASDVVSPGPTPSWTSVPEPAGGYPWVALLWSVGALALLLRSAVGSVLAGRVARRATPVRSEAWRLDARRSAARLGVAPLPALLITDEVRGPAVVGTARPALLLPPTVLAAPAAFRRAILDHELAHVARHDVLLARLSVLATAIHWYNPLVWWAARRQALAAECACDDAVLTGGLSRRDYARMLVEAVARHSSAPRLAGAGFGAAPVVKRVEALASTTRAHNGLTAPERWVLVAAAVVLVVPVAGVVLASADQPPREQVFLLGPGVQLDVVQVSPSSVRVRGRSQDR